MTRQGDYDSFRRRYKEFVYESYRYDVQSDGLHITFCFSVTPADGGSERLRFEPTAHIESRRFLDFGRISKHTLDTLVFNIGMIELISYWKCYCPPLVKVAPFKLSKTQIAFWKKLYYNGLGEFFYTNGINASEEDFMEIRCDSTHPAEVISESLFKTSEHCDSHIVPIGGGKDSVVTLEILMDGRRRASLTKRPLPLIMNPRGATIECVNAAGYSMNDVIVIRRTIHPLLLDLNKQGALNGHTPFSAMLAFYTLLASALTGSRPNIALSNENSANESTVAGTKVNHQYSKSLEFENDFREYVRGFISPEFNYYSFLRPLSELQIAMLFSKYKRYHSVFRSCNAGSKQDIWCGHCAKCLFAYIILSPFIAPKQLSAIFGKNMLDDESLSLEFNQLIGSAETKPFECVGTVSEVNSALSICIAKWYRNERPALLRNYCPGLVTTPLDKQFSDHNLPNEDTYLLDEEMYVDYNLRGFDDDDVKHRMVEQYDGYADLFNLLAGKEILIAGYGREGKSSMRLLRKMFPCRTFDVAKNNDEILAALERKEYDMILKSPGIPNFVFEGHCDMDRISSQTDIFLQVYGDITVGVTGTKGKSTTTSLIYETLSIMPLGTDVILAGNIGIPLFDIIPRINLFSTVVAELSCHQLENIHKAPHVAVLLNLFEEHLDHYHDYSGYCGAKMQIAEKQSKDDVFFYCEDNEDLVREVRNRGEAIVSRKRPYSLAEAKAFEPLQGRPLPLAGDHNLSNMYVAWLAIDELGGRWSYFEKALDAFEALDHRLQYVDTVRGVTFYNDSISTIPQATIAALEALKQVETLILGGYDRGIDYTPLAEYLVKQPLGKAVKNLVLFGSAGLRIEKAMMDIDAEETKRRTLMCCYDSNYSMEDAVQFACENSGEGKICLLSPAASSYDHYKNFEERGDDFKECVRKLKNARCN
ncbi:MAG: UDP-N-acetylmuramoyl-L-alanine--D-glutamate ligase [Bacteroidales bacterium]|nr:UDP-N-acetylmuramoyl-L-alanine--D-glutamate ligase [Bacteroidales bacterium]